MWLQKKIQIKQKSRGFHLITQELESQLPEIRFMNAGLIHFFLQHTSASLSINENADGDVRKDLESFFNRLIPEGASYFQHTLEGSDDMPAHIKSVLIGQSITVPLSSGGLALGMWQGIYLCEHRNYGGTRTILVTIQGE